METANAALFGADSCIGSLAYLLDMGFKHKNRLARNTGPDRTAFDERGKPQLNI